MKDLSGMRVLITGAAGGIGREYARQFLEQGCHLVLTDIDGDRLSVVAKEIFGSSHPSSGSILGLIEVDIAYEQGCADLFEKCKELGCEADILINNAGIITYGDFHEVPSHRWETLMQVNVLAPMRLTSHFLPGMISRGMGHLVFMSSVAGFIATSQGTPYSCSKFALRGFGMGLSGELKGTGVQVTNVYPWWVKTDLLRSPAYGNARIDRLPLPGLIINRPGQIVREIIRGIRRNRLHVYPGFYAKGAWLASRACPLVSRQAN